MPNHQATMPFFMANILSRLSRMQKLLPCMEQRKLLPTFCKA